MATEIKKRPATVASTCRKLILEGKTDDQIWRTLKKQFQIDDSKKHYIGWYRAEVRRKGLDQPKVEEPPAPPPPPAPTAKPARRRKAKAQPAAA